VSLCPICESPQIVIVVSPWPSAWCDRCGAQWVQEGSDQRHVRKAEPIPARPGLRELPTSMVGSLS
jgi:hypothetical protein